MVTRRWPVQARLAATEFLRTTCMLAFFLVACASIDILQSYISHSLYDLNTLFAESHNPCFIRIIATPPTSIFQNGMPNVVLDSPSNVLEPHTAPDPHPTSCMHLVAHNHACPLLFSESHISRSGKHVFSQDFYNPSFLFRSGISKPLLTPHPVFFNLNNPKQTLVW